MGDWKAYADISRPTNAVMDQITLNAVLLSSRIGVQVAPESLPKLMDDWEPVYTVISSPTSLFTLLSQEYILLAEPRESV